MKQQVIVIGMHKLQLYHVYVEEMGPCIFCAKPVYLSKKGVDFELTIVEYKKLKDKKLIGMECALEFPEVAQEIKKMMSLPDYQKLKVLNKLLKDQNIPKGGL